MPQPRSLELPIIAGGRLITQPSFSLESVGAENFTRLLNVYRDKDKLRRIPGWIKFQPDTGVSVTNQYTFDGVESVLRLGELIRGDGTRVILGASLTLIKYYDTVTDAWVTIGTGFSSSGLPWQVVVLSNVIFFNNAVNLPQYWKIGDAAVTPLHELREAGISSVGRIASYNGFLFVGDIVEIKADQLAVWMNGYANYTASGTTAKGANFTILVGEHRTQFDVTTGAATITATLPVVTLGSYPLYFWIKKVDAGAGTVITSPVIVDQAVVLDSVDDIALVWWNGTRWVARVFPSGTIPAHDAYGIVSTEIEQHYPDEQAWSELGDGTNWAPSVNAVMAAASTTINLPFKPFNWTARTTRLGVINAGEGGGILGGQTLYPEGVLITAVAAFSAAAMGVPITIEVTTDTVITYPRVVGATRWTSVATFVGKQRMGNGSRIVAMLELNGLLIVYQEDAIFITRYTGVAKTPFALRPKYVGKGVPMFGDCIASIRNAYHLYPATDGSFLMFDGQTDPIEHRLTEDAKDLFFSGLVPTDRCWAVDNPLLQQIWFCTPAKVMAYRYERDSEGASEINAIVGAAVFARRPGGTVDWFVLTIGRFVYQFGVINNVATAWLRDGVATSAQITSGLNSLRSQSKEKMLVSYTPLLASPSPDAQMSVQLRGTYNPSAPLTDNLSPAEVLPSPAGDNLVACCFQSIYMQDELVLTDTRDIDWAISGRLFEFHVIGGGGVTRSGNV